MSSTVQSGLDSAYIWDQEKELHISPSERGAMVTLPSTYSGAKFRIVKPIGGNNSLTLLPRDCLLEGGNKMVIIGAGIGAVELNFHNGSWFHKSM